MHHAHLRIFYSVLLLGILGLGSASAMAGGAITMKLGQVELWDDSQLLGAQQRVFDDSSRRTFGIAWEHRSRSGIGLGVEYLTYRHDYSPSTGNAGEAKTQMVLFSARKYFIDSGVFHPFVGMGLGLGHTTVSRGPDLSPDVNFQLQANTGIEFRFDNFGFMVEVKGLYNDSDGPANNRYDPSGTGIFGGMSFIF